MSAHFEPRSQESDQRRAQRRSLQLGVGKGGESVMIHDLSLSGALIETSVPMLVGSGFEIELPHAGAVEAVVMWNSGEFYGCQFELPISAAALSAALLQSAPRTLDPAPDSHDPIGELKQLNADVERLAEKMESLLKRLTDE
jgi:hypothetical protein